MATLTLKKLRGYSTTRWTIDGSPLIVETPNFATSADVKEFIARKLMDNPSWQAALGILGETTITFRVKAA